MCSYIMYNHLYTIIYYIVLSHNITNSVAVKVSRTAAETPRVGIQCVRGLATPPMCVHIYIYIHIHTCIYIYIYIHVCVYVYIYIYMYVYIYIIHTYIHIYIHSYINTYIHWYDIMLYHIIWYHAIPHHIMSCHVMSCHGVMSCYDSSLSEPKLVLLLVYIKSN